MVIEKAVILAGGEGIRMHPVSKYIPKCFLPIFDEPLIIKQIDWLLGAGVKEIIIAIDNKSGELIASQLSSAASEKCVKINIVVEKEVKGIGYSLLQLEPKIGGEPFIFLLGDEYFVRPGFFTETKKIRGTSITLGAVTYKDEKQIMQGCNFLFNENMDRILKLIEKPLASQIVSPWCWSGAAVFDHNVFYELEQVCTDNNIKSNMVLINALNNLIDRDIPVKCFMEESENINLTSVYDYYRAFDMEFRMKKANA